jgi:hypothetical protein
MGLLACFVLWFAGVEADEKGVGEAVENTVVAVATVVEVDKENRTLRLRDEDGTEWTFVAGPEVRNFDRIERGDRVITEYYEMLAVGLAPKGSGIKVRKDEVWVQRANRGEKPGAKVIHAIEATGVVKAIDPDKREVTVQGAKKTVVLHVAEDVDLSRIKVGDEVEGLYVRSYAISVEPAPEVSGTVEMKITSVALGVGYQWGKGTLTLRDGGKYRFDVKGVSVVDVGISEAEASGEVYHLVEPADLEGTYVSGEAGATVVHGASAMVMKNDKGVVLKLKSRQKGLKFKLAPEGVTISKVRPVE